VLAGEFKPGEKIKVSAKDRQLVLRGLILGAERPLSKPELDLPPIVFSPCGHSTRASRLFARILVSW